VTPRRYEQTRRAEQTAETRRRILDAVQEGLRKGPVRALTLDAVARDTGVARSTVYLIFGSRDGLIEAVAKDVAKRSGIAAIVAAEGDPDARETVRRGIRGGVQMYAADPEVFRALHALSRLDAAAFGAADPLLDRHRTVGMATVAGRLAEQGALRDGVDAAEAADLLWVLTGFEAFDQLFTGRGLDAAAVSERLVAMAERAVLRAG
jgi:AcrR family transcriptional regulator